MFTQTLGITLDGIDGQIVTVEVDVHPGLPQFNIVGLPDSSVREAKDRVRSAILNSGFDFPLQRITVNLAPADSKKEGSSLDLAIASGILFATEQITSPSERIAIIGELSLDGSTRPIVGALPLTIAAIQAGIHKLIISSDSIEDLVLLHSYNLPVEIYPVQTLVQMAKHFNGEEQIPKYEFSSEINIDNEYSMLDLSDVYGQILAKRALEIAAAGRHNLLLIGPPGCGKSMLSTRIQSILPKLTSEEALEVNKLYSVANPIDRQKRLIRQRPFRNPHHSISAAGLVGGGIPPYPGEITLAHHGVLFLDEIAEFPKTILDQLRQPLENGVVTISRARYQYTMPSRFQLLAAMNPCPCGYYNSDLPCKCTHYQISRYQGKVSGPLLDRFHMYVWMKQEQHIPATSKTEKFPLKNENIQERINQAFLFQIQRNPDKQTNAFTSTQTIRSWGIEQAALDLWQQSSIFRKLSSRSSEQVIRVARTIADLSGRETIEMHDIAESLQYTDCSALPLLLT